MNSMMYQAYQNHMDLTAPWRTAAASALKYLNLVPQGISDKIYRPPPHLSEPSGSARAHVGDLPAVGVRAGGRGDQVEGQPPRPPRNPDPDGRSDRHENPADQGQRFRQEQAAEMVRGEPDQLRAVAMQGRVSAGLSRFRAARRLRVDEPRAPYQAAHRTRRSSGEGRAGEGRNHQDFL